MPIGVQPTIMVRQPMQTMQPVLMSNQQINRNSTAGGQIVAAPVHDQQGQSLKKL